MENKKTIVIAGNRQEFENLLKLASSAEEAVKYVYAGNFQDIAAIAAKEILEIGTYYERPDYHEIRKLARSRVQ